MQRRKFIKAASVMSACSMAAFAAPVPAASELKPDLHSYRCRITVLKRTFNEDFYNEYPYGKPTACDRFEEGQVFETTSVWDPPAGFCLWAWSEFRFTIHGIHAGNPGPMVCCCTDGLRPVFFKFERIVA